MANVAVMGAGGWVKMFVVFTTEPYYCKNTYS